MLYTYGIYVFYIWYIFIHIRYNLYDIIIIKRDRGRRVVIMNQTNEPKYHDKRLKLLNTDQFTKLNHVPFKKIDAKIRKVFWKIKTNIILQNNSHLYPTDSCPGNFYGTAKTHKILPTDNVENPLT